MERDVHFQSLPLHILQSPQYRSPPSRSPLQSSHWVRLSISRAPFHCLSKSPVNENPLHVPQRGPCRERDAHFQSLLIHIARSPEKKKTKTKKLLHTKISHLSLKVPGKGAPLLVPQQGPYGQRCSVSRANGLFVHLYPSESPVKELSHEMVRKPTVTVRGSARGRKIYIQWGANWFPREIVYDTAIATPVPCNLQHYTFHLGFGRPEPRFPACVFITLYRMSPAHLYLLTPDPGYGSPRNPELRTRGWMYGRQHRLVHSYWRFETTYCFHIILIRAITLCYDNICNLLPSSDINVLVKIINKTLRRHVSAINRHHQAKLERSGTWVVSTLVYTTYVPERCSNLNWWWRFIAETRRLKALLPISCHIFD